jgi:hypothetical protein
MGRRVNGAVIVINIPLYSYVYLLSGRTMRPILIDAEYSPPGTF